MLARLGRQEAEQVVTGDDLEAHELHSAHRLVSYQQCAILTHIVRDLKRNRNRANRRYGPSRHIAAQTRDGAHGWRVERNFSKRVVQDARERSCCDDTTISAVVEEQNHRRVSGPGVHEEVAR